MTPDYADLVRRLRGQAKRDGYIDEEAAEAIEAQAREAERLKQERARYHDALVARHGGEPIALLAELDEAREELAEALAARETYAMTARQDIIEKAKALDELEAWLTSETRYDRSVDVLGPHARAANRDFELTLYQGGHHGSTQDTAAESRAPTLAAAIRAALEKARAE